MSPKPLFIFIPGACHTHTHFTPIISALRQRGYEGTALDVATNGPDAINISPGDEVKKAREDVEKLINDGGRDVVLVPHSMGGVTGSQCVHGLSKNERISQGEAGGIVRVVFLAAFLPQEDESLLGLRNRIGDLGKSPWLELDPDRPGLGRPTEPAKEYLYHDLPPEESERWYAELQPLSLMGMDRPAKGTCWDVDIPKMYVFTSRDRAIGLDFQKLMVDAIKGESMKTVAVDCGHSPFLSHKEELVEMLIEDV